MHGFRITESALYDYVLSFPEPAHLKDPKSAKYICSNKHNLKIYGINKPEAIVGRTVHDLDAFMKPYWGRSFADKIDNFDSAVYKAASTITDKNRIFLDKFGLVHVQDMSKVPITGENNTITAILTTSFDVTHKLNRYDIWGSYKKIYTKRRDANFYFMKHLLIADFFGDILSNKEILCLLYMTENNSHKYVSAKLHISPRTVETHVNNMSNKLKGKSITEIIEFLRITNSEKNL